MVVRLLALFLAAGVVSAHAQSLTGPTRLDGVVIDTADAAIAGARVSVLTPAGRVVQTTTTDGGGAFSAGDVPAGSYTILVEKSLFSPHSDTVAMPIATPLRIVLEPGGFVDTVVVTARRTEARLAETPQKIEVIDAVDLERTVGADITDVLKKTSGVDVIQYTGALSGIGIRGFRPQFSGVNKRSLLLIDGRPAGVTNLATLLVDNVDRIEVLKGAASAVYGSSAMGGVVNVITRRSQGKLSGSARIGAGSFGTTELAGRIGGNATTRLDFDAAATVFEQRDDIRMGNGEVRPATSYRTYDVAGRLGIALARTWRVEGRADVYRGRDISAPPDIAFGTIGQSSKDIERNGGDARISGHVGTHVLSFTGYRATEASHTSNVTTSNPLDLPYLPYLSFESDLTWTGAQARDSWDWASGHTAVIGLDYERVTSVSRSYTRTGAGSAPFSADSHKRTVGVYAENALRLAGGRTVVTLGGRIDRIDIETVATPFKANFTPSQTAFTVFNPSVGATHALIAGVRVHGTVGRAFIPAEAVMLTGFTTTVVGGRTQISQGNPDLKPERSTSFDLGAGWSSEATRLDATFFRTVVKDRFITNVVVSNPAPPDPIVLSVANGLDAHIAGLDLEVEQRLGARFGVFANVTHYFRREERLASGAAQDILNVARNTVRFGTDLDIGALSARVLARYVHGRKDNNFNAPGFPIVAYDNFAIVDVSATYRLARRHAFLLAVNNLFDTFYYEKLGYPLQGAAVKASYRFAL